MKSKLASRSNEIHLAYSIGDYECARRFQRTFTLGYLAYEAYLRADCADCTHFTDAAAAKHHFLNLFNYYIPSVATSIPTYTASGTVAVTGSKSFQDGTGFNFQDGGNYDFQ
mgnify:CR=1 FL=1